MARTKCLLSAFLFGLAAAAPQASQPSASITSVTSSVSASPSALPSLTTEEQDKLFNLHEELVNIPSISNDEVKCAEFVSNYLKKLGYYVEKVPVGNTSTYNVFAYPQALKDEGVWPEVLITSHLDTVRINCSCDQIRADNLGASFLSI
jgi:acetylornithine deacetylase